MGTKRRTIKNWFEAQHSAQEKIANEWLHLDDDRPNILFSFSISLIRLSCLHIEIHAFDTVWYIEVQIQSYKIIWNRIKCKLPSFFREAFFLKYFYFAIIFIPKKKMYDGFEICKCEKFMKCET